MRSQGWDSGDGIGVLIRREEDQNSPLSLREGAICKPGRQFSPEAYLLAS